MSAGQVRRTYLVVPNISPGEHPPMLQRKSQRKFELMPELPGAGTLNFPLESKEAPECALFVRKEYVWRPNSEKEGSGPQQAQKKVVYEPLSTKQNNLQILQPSKFLDFRYRGRLDRDNLVSFFESVALGKKSAIDVENIDFRQELYPKVFARDYVHASIPIE